ncbi:acyl-CoA dehydrogenase [Ideonella sp.]|uniref:acyl-CoA dehydrogenase n=1 Tax=Ideonella sp. TaxID=1929293 RepID=UPI0035AE1BF1
MNDMTIADPGIDWNDEAPATVPAYLSDPREIDFFLWEFFRADETVMKNAPFHQGTRESVEALRVKARAHSQRLSAAYSAGDRDPARRIDDDTVHIPAAFHELWDEHLRDWNWMRRQGDEATGYDEGEVMYPHLVNQVMGESFIGANPAFMTYCGFTPAAATLLRQRGTERQKALFVDKLDTVEWDACFCATEAEAGSDLTAVRTTARPLGDDVYAITGEKVYISAGMHSLTKNTIHLVIGRMASAAQSPMSLSCFIVPRYWPEADGSLSPNNVVCAHVEDKMGLNGCANTRLVFGRGEQPTRGFLLGNKANVALLQLANLMTKARVHTGIHSVGLASSAYLHAVRYARQRTQGARFDESSNPRAPKVPIIEHLDVQRMLLDMKSKVEGCRILMGRISYHASMVQHYQYLQDHLGQPIDRAELDRHSRLMYMYSPIGKAYISEEAWNVVTQAIQVHGAEGYLRRRPLEQYARDMKILTIWEGTNYIQSQHLVRDRLGFGRQSTAFGAFEEEVSRSLAQSAQYPGLTREFAAVAEALRHLKDALQDIAAQADAGKLLLVSQFCSRVLTMFGDVMVAWNLLEAACIATRRLGEIGEDHADRAFYSGKLKSARYFVHNVLPRVATLRQVIGRGDASYVHADSLEFGFAEGV